MSGSVLTRVIEAFLREHYGAGPYGPGVYQIAERRAREHIAMQMALWGKVPEGPPTDAELDERFEELVERMLGGARS